MRLHSIKKKLALWLAMAILFGVAAPFGYGVIAPVEVMASTSGILTSVTDELLEYDDQRGVHIRSVTATNPQDILLAWPMDLSEDGLHVLRFFTDRGEKIELWVELPASPDDPGDPVVANSARVTRQRFSREPTAVSPNPGDSIYRLDHSVTTLHETAGDIWGRVPISLTSNIIYAFEPASLPVPENPDRRGQFVVFIENGLSHGWVHDFTWEFYCGVTLSEPLADNLTHAQRYSDPTHPIHSQMWEPSNRRPTGFPRYDRGRGNQSSNTVFVFPGFNPNDIDIIPFAQAMERVTPPPHDYPPLVTGPGGKPIEVDHTPSTDINDEGRERWNEPFFPITTSTRLTSRNSTKPPQYATHRLNTTDDSGEGPAEGEIGMDIRVLLPRFFDERTGRFDFDFVEGLEQEVSLGRIASDVADRIGSVISMGSTLAHAESFQIEVRGIRYLEDWDGTDDPMRLHDPALPPAARGVTFIPSSTEREDDVDWDIELLDASMLRTEGEGFSVARFKVGGLQPSILYDQLTLSFNPGISNVFRDRFSIFNHGDGAIGGHGGVRLNTLLHFYFPPAIAGNATVVARPYRWNSLETVAGTYYFDMSATAGRGTVPPIAMYANEETGDRIQVLLFEDPGVPNLHYRIRFELRGRPVIDSQLVIIIPDDSPSVGPPNNFDIIFDDIHDYKPRRLEYGESGTIADLNFTAEWLIGSRADLISMLDALPDRQSEMTVRYTLFRGISPDIDPPTQPFADIDVILSRAMTSPGAIGYRINYYGEDNAPDSALVFGDWIVRGDNVFASVLFDDLVAAHRTYPNRPVSTPDNEYQWVTPFQFPGVYHFYVRPVGQWVGSNPNPDPSAIAPLDTWPLSAFDYITLNDFEQMEPPPPLNLRAMTQADHQDPPRLTVDFAVPIMGIRAYWERQYPFAPLVTFNAYISASEGNINLLKEPPASGDDDKRDSLEQTIDFVQRIKELDDGTWVIELTEAEQQLLRGGAVFRIENIPLMRNFTPESAKAFGARDTKDRLEEFYEAIENPLQLNNIRFDIIGLDQNQKYFMFADLEIARYVSDDCPVSGFMGEETYDPIQRADGRIFTIRSAPTELVGDITISTPEVPDPSEVDPPAPTGLDYCRDTLTETEVTLYWNAIIPEPNVTIEFEIIRVNDSRIHQALLELMKKEEAGELGFKDVVQALREGNPDIPALQEAHPRIMGWRIHRHNIPNVEDYIIEAWCFEKNDWVDHINDPNHEDAEGLFIFDPYYSLEPARFSFRDGTLRPNNLYFYYVRTVRLVDVEAPVKHTLERRSAWVEESVTTPVVTAVENLRIEDGSDRPGFDPQTQRLVSWTHPGMTGIIDGRGESLIFEYQLFTDDEGWGAITAVPNSALNHNNVIDGRFYFMVRNLSPGEVYQMRVRLFDKDTGDASLWSNIVVFVTDWDPDYPFIQETENWLEYLNRLLRELLRNPYWIAADTPQLLHLVYRPDSFLGLLDGTAGLAVPLYNTNAQTVIYYVPMSSVLAANENRRGFRSQFEDMDITFSPRFINADLNRAVLDMMRHLNDRNTPVNDSFVRIAMQRQSVMGQLHGTPPLSEAVEIRLDLMGVSDAVRNIATWDVNITNQIERFIVSRVECPIVYQNILGLVSRGDYEGERKEYVILDYLAVIEAEVVNEISRLVSRDVPITTPGTGGGILAHQQIPVTALDAPVLVAATNATYDMTVNGFVQIQGGGSLSWQQMPVTEQSDGHFVTAQAPGVYAFSGRVVNIPGIETVPSGNTVSTLVGRFGLEDFFGTGGVDLYLNATRYMVAGSIARMANAPMNAEPINWVAQHMNVALSSRNATGWVAQQEAVALVMALYAVKTETSVDSILIRNHQHTAGMALDNRYAQAVRAAFELEIIGEGFQPERPVTIGDLLNMLAVLELMIG